MPGRAARRSDGVSNSGSSRLSEAEAFIRASAGFPVVMSALARERRTCRLMFARSTPRSTPEVTVGPPAVNPAVPAPAEPPSTSPSRPSLRTTLSSASRSPRPEGWRSDTSRAAAIPATGPPFVCACRSQAFPDAQQGGASKQSQSVPSAQRAKPQHSSGRAQGFRVC